MISLGIEDKYYEEEFEEVREEIADITEKEIKEFLKLMDIEEWF